MERYLTPGTPKGDPVMRHFNVAPTSKVAILFSSRGIGLELQFARWGFIPSWWNTAKSPSYTFNAPIEEIFSEPLWQQPILSARCLIPALGWYEWRPVDRIDLATKEVKKFKQPSFIFRRNGQPFCFAGMMSIWFDPLRNEPRMTCSILTQPASLSLRSIHHRMPVVLPESAFHLWADPHMRDRDRVCEIVDNYSLTDFEHYAVSVRVNRSRSNSAELINPL